MNYFSYDYQKFLTDHFVYDTWQFVINTQKNVVTAGYCFHVISSLIAKMDQEHLEWQDEVYNDLSELISKKQKGSVSINANSLPEFKVDMFGLPIDYAFLIDKYIKDFFQYLRNAFDSAAQVINFALLANEAIKIEGVDFKKITERLKKQKYAQLFPKTISALTKIENSQEFAYMSEFNNRIKHICDAKVIMSRELFGEGVTSKIGAFFKKGAQFAEEDIMSFTKKVFDFAEGEILSILDAVTEEVKFNHFSQGRLHTLDYYWQQVKGDPSSSFIAIFVEVNNSITELPEVLRVLLVADSGKDNGGIASVNSDYKEFLVRDRNKNYIGKYSLDEPINEEGLVKYRKYKKDQSVDGMLAFIEHTKLQNKIYPMFMDGTLTKVEE